MRWALAAFLAVLLSACEAGGGCSAAGGSMSGGSMSGALGAGAGMAVDIKAGLLPDGGPEPDAGPADAGPPDAGPTDAGPDDAGPDAGPPDAGPADAGPPACSDLTGFLAWHVADDVCSSGNNLEPVATWTSRGSGISLTNATTAQRPICRSTCDSGKLNDLPCLRFDGDDDRIVAGSSYGTAQPTTICAVVRVRSYTASGTIWDSSGSGTRQRLTSTTASTLTAFAGGSLSTPTMATPNAYQTICVAYDGVSSSILIDGTSVAAGSMGTEGLGVFRLGSRADNAAFSHADLLEVAAWSDANSSRVSDFQSRAECKYGALPQ